MGQSFVLCRRIARSRNRWSKWEQNCALSSCGMWLLGKGTSLQHPLRDCRSDCCILEWQEQRQRLETMMRRVVALALTCVIGWACLGACKKKSATQPQAPMSPQEQGKSVAFRKGCMACHSADGSKRQGPTFKALYGAKRVVLTKGKERTVVADEAYIRRSIIAPKADLVKAYRYSLMIKVPISPEELTALVAYIKSLSPQATGPKSRAPQVTRPKGR